MSESLEKFNESTFNVKNWGKNTTEGTSGHTWMSEYLNHPLVGKKISEICDNFNSDLCYKNSEHSVVKKVIVFKITPNGYFGKIYFEQKTTSEGRNYYSKPLTFYADSDDKVKFLTKSNTNMFIPQNNILVVIDCYNVSGVDVIVWDLKTGLVIDQTNYDP